MKSDQLGAVQKGVKAIHVLSAWLLVAVPSERGGTAPVLGYSPVSTFTRPESTACLSAS
jgi:hypothetical protein